MLARILPPTTHSSLVLPGESRKVQFNINLQISVESGGDWFWKQTPKFT